MTTTPTLLTTAEVCERFHIHRATLERWVERGHLEPVKVLPGKNGKLYTLTAVEQAAVAAMRRPRGSAA
jgi:excisionase family DNA binding protein